MAPLARRASSTSRAAPCTGSSGTASPLGRQVSQGRSERSVKVTGVARDGVEAPAPGLAVCFGCAQRQPAPADLARQAEVFQPAPLVALDPGGEDGLLPGPGGELETLQLLDDGQQARPGPDGGCPGPRAASATGTS